MTDSGSDVLTVTNWALALAVFVGTIALVIALRYRLAAEKRGETPVQQARGRVHALVGTFLLLIAMFLGLVTATGALLRMLDVNGGLALAVQLLAVGSRAAVLISVTAWIAYALEGHLRGRSARADRLVERVLHLGL
jgi:hypothetical protein